MTEDLVTRSRDQIQKDLKQIERELIENNTALKLYEDKLQQFSDEEKSLLNNLISQLNADEEPSIDEVENMSEEIKEFFNTYHLHIQKERDLDRRVTDLEAEDLPYARDEFETFLFSLSSRLDYDAVFDYYRKPRLGSDMLENTVVDLYFLREYQYLVASGSLLSKDARYFYVSLQKLKEYEESWSNKGFLKSEADPNYQPSNEFGVEVSEQRESIAEVVSNVLMQLAEYSDLCMLYKHNISSEFTGLVRDENLEEIYRILNNVLPQLYSRSETFESVDYDPYFLQAAARYVDTLAKEHARAGRISKSPEDRVNDRERIDAMNMDEMLKEVEFFGFDSVPENMYAVVSPANILESLKSLIPPEFVQYLESIEYQHIILDDTSTARTVGRCIRIFDKNTLRLISARIEIFRDLYVLNTNEAEANDKFEIEVRLARKHFMATMYHEIGHIAQHLLDYDEIVSWERVRAEDSTAVTWNVYNKKTENPDQVPEEDFADSFSLYLVNPAILEIISPSRFTYMKDFLHRHLQSEQIGSFDIFNQRLKFSMELALLGLTDEEVKEIYLSHERNK